MTVSCRDFKSSLSDTEISNLEILDVFPDLICRPSRSSRLPSKRVTWSDNVPTRKSPTSETDRSIDLVQEGKFSGTKFIVSILGPLPKTLALFSRLRLPSGYSEVQTGCERV